MRAMTDILALFLTGVAGVLGMVVGFVLFVAAIPIALAFSACLFMGLFCGVGFLFQPNAHNLVNTLGFFGYAAGIAGVAAVLYGLPSVMRRRKVARQQHEAQQTLSRIGGLRLASDANFNDRG